MSEFSDIINVFNGRAAFYEFFTEAFNEPANEDFVKTMEAFAPHFKTMAEEVDSPELKEGAQELEDFLKSNIDTNELNRGFTSLFLLGGNSIPTAESVYLSTTKLMKQEPWDEIIETYYKHSFGVPEDMKQTEEHVSAEMLFMYYLAKKTSAELEKSNEAGAEELISAQLDFMNNHIIKWVPEMSDFILKSAFDHVSLYKTLAKLLKGFLYYDQQLLTELLSEEA